MYKLCKGGKLKISMDSSQKKVLIKMFFSIKMHGTGDAEKKWRNQTNLFILLKVIEE